MINATFEQKEREKRKLNKKMLTELLFLPESRLVKHCLKIITQILIASSQLELNKE